MDEEIKNGIPSERIFIGGFSQGGAVALYTALSSSLRFGGVLALSTWLPMHAKVGEFMKPGENKLTTPIFTGHGDSDPMVPLQWAQLSQKALEAIGFSNLTFKTYRGMGHSSSEDVIHHLTSNFQTLLINSNLRKWTTLMILSRKSLPNKSQPSHSLYFFRKTHSINIVSLHLSNTQFCLHLNFLLKLF